jgi:hypothetical protein
VITPAWLLLPEPPLPPPEDEDVDGVGVTPLPFFLLQPEMASIARRRIPDNFLVI